MPFPTVKSDPWQKGRRRTRRRFQLWSTTFWGRLVKAAKEQAARDISEECITMIVEMNRLLYGGKK